MSKDPERNRCKEPRRAVLENPRQHRSQDSAQEWQYQREESKRLFSACHSVDPLPLLTCLRG